MNRGMIVIGVLLVGLMIATIYQQQKGVGRPWTQCKESMVTQMFSGECTPSQFSDSPMRGPLQDVPQKEAPQNKTPGNEVPQTEIPQTGGYKGSRLEDM
jgi:hypothetical protein